MTSEQFDLIVSRLREQDSQNRAILIRLTELERKLLRYDSNNRLRERCVNLTARNIELRRQLKEATAFLEKDQIIL